jgi:hypothetical protein
VTADPQDVWRLIQRADETMKYAPNREAADARAKAASLLDEAQTLTSELDDAGQIERLTQLIALRRADLDRYAGGP